MPGGAVSWWPADGSGADLVGTNPASVQPASFALGKVGRAFDLTSTDVSVANSPSLNFGSNVDFSIETWIRSFGAFANPGSTVIYPIVPLVQKRAAPGLDGVGYMLALYNGRLAFWLGAARTPATPAPLFMCPEPDLRDGLFHHLAVTVSRTAGDGGRLYLDGANVLTFDPTAQEGDLSNTGQVLIGIIGTATNSYFNGYIDEVTIYNRALSPDEIQRIFQAGSLGKCKAAPVLSLSLAQSSNSATLFWPATGFSLYQAPALSSPTIWSPVTNPIGLEPGGSGVTIPLGTPSGFFRLKAGTN